MSHTEPSICPRCFADVRINVIDDHLAWHDTLNKLLNNRQKIVQEDRADV